MKKSNSYLIGLLQAIGVFVYCVLISGALNYLSRVFIQSPGFLGTAVILAIIVLSAAITGSIVFGYPAYLFLKYKKTKEALSILAFTLVFCLTIIIIGIILIAVLG